MNSFIEANVLDNHRRLAIAKPRSVTVEARDLAVGPVVAHLGPVSNRSVLPAGPVALRIPVSAHARPAGVSPFSAPAVPVANPVVADRVVADRVVADRVVADRVVADRVVADPVVADRVVADPVVANLVDTATIPLLDVAVGAAAPARESVPPMPAIAAAAIEPASISGPISGIRGWLAQPPAASTTFQF